MLLKTLSKESEKEVDNLKKIGFIGFGGQAKEQVELVMKTKYAKVVAICDSNYKMFESLPDFIMNLPKYTDYKEMILKENLDFVFLCVPHYLHREVSEYAVKNDVHVIKEKPLACNVLEGTLLVEKSNETNKSILTLTQRRAHPAYLCGKDKLEELGDIFLIKGEYTFNGGPYDYGWRGIKEMAGGGAALDMGYHILDVIIWYFGLPIEVNSMLTNQSRKDVNYETEDSSIINFKTKSGALGNLFLSRATQPKKEDLTIYGSNGVMILKRDNITIFNQKGEVIENLQFERSWDNAIISQIDSLMEMIDEGGLENSSIHLEHLKFLDAIYRSDIEKKVIKL